MRSSRFLAILLLLGAVLAGLPAASCGGAPDEAAFTEDVAERFRQELGPAAVRTGSRPLTLEILRPGSAVSMTVSLDNLWRECTLRPAQCEASTERTLRTIVQGQGLAPSREALRATVRDDAWLAGARQSGVEPVARPFFDTLKKVYVFDAPDAMAAVRAADLEALKMSEDELDALALANLAQALPDFPHEPVAAGSPIQVLHAGDSYEASRLLLHDRWRALAAEVKGDLLACAPSRDAVFFVGSGESAETLREFRQLVEKRARVESHALTPVVLRWTPAGWVEEGGGGRG